MAADDSTMAPELEIEFDPFSEQIFWDPYPTYRLLRRHAPVYYIEERDIWALTRYEDCRRVLKDHRTFASKGGGALDGTTSNPSFFGTMAVIGLDQPEHTVMRKQMNPAWTPPEIRKLESMVAEFTDELVDAFIERGEADFANDFGTALPSKMVCALLGVDESDRRFLAERWDLAISRGYGVEGLPQTAVDAAAQMKALFRERMLERRKSPREDLMTAIAVMDGANGGLIPIEDAAGVGMMVYFGGIRNTASLIANSLWMLVDEPDIRRRVAAEPDIGQRAVEEFMRLESPISSSGRVALQDVEIEGRAIKAGSRVGVFIGSANRDEAMWGPTSEEIDIDRPPVRALSLGDGIHFCLGAHLARLEGRVALRTLLSRIPEYEIVYPIKRSDRVNERAITSLPVRFNAS
jgi:cytochrome P450